MLDVRIAVYIKKVWLKACVSFVKVTLCQLIPCSYLCPHPALKKQNLIQKLIACCLLLVFATGSAPKTFFHDVFADHVDLPGCTIDHGSVTLHNVQVHCDFDDLVVPASYLPAKNMQLEAPIVFLGEVKTFYSRSFVSPPMQFRESRGPPSA